MIFLFSKDEELEEIENIETKEFTGTEIKKKLNYTKSLEKILNGKVVKN